MLILIASNLFSSFRKKKKNWIEHIMRGEGLLREVIEGRMEGKRGPGRPRIGVLDDLLERDAYAAMKRRAEDRSGWRVWMTGTCHVAEHWRERNTTRESEDLL